MNACDLLNKYAYRVNVSVYTVPANELSQYKVVYILFNLDIMFHPYFSQTRNSILTFVKHVKYVCLCTCCVCGLFQKSKLEND